MDRDFVGLAVPIAVWTDAVQQLQVEGNFIHREHDLIVEAADRDIPMLGVCFGSQILASALSGRDQVFRRCRCEID